MQLEIQVLAWGPHKNVAAFNRLIEDWYENVQFILPLKCKVKYVYVPNKGPQCQGSIFYLYLFYYRVLT